MTEQIITKNFYNLLTSGGAQGGNYPSTYLMNISLSRKSVSANSSFINALKSVNLSDINSYYKLYPVRYSKLLSALTEGEVYGTPFEEMMTTTLTQNNYAIVDNSTNLNSGVKIVTTYVNDGNSNIIINGVLLRVVDSSNSYNVILTKFDADITVAPTESYQFALDLGNLFQTFPATIGS